MGRPPAMGVSDDSQYDATLPPLGQGQACAPSSEA
jgi:hypothetical protein